MEDAAATPVAAAATRSGPVRLLVAWLIGVPAAVLRLGFPHAGTAGTAIALAATGIALIWLLEVWSVRTRRLGSAFAAATLFAVAAASLTYGFVYPFAVVGVGTTLAYGALGRWSLPRRWPQRAVPIAGPALAPLIVAMLTWRREADVAAFAVLALLSVAVLELWARSHRTAAAVDHAVGRFAHGVSVVITTVLASAVMIVVVIPINLVSRFFRYSPIDPGWANDATAWVTVDPRRIRTPEGGAAAPDSTALLEVEPSKAVRRRGRLRAIVPIGLVLVAVLVLVWPQDPQLARSDRDPAPQAGGTFTKKFEEDPAFADAPWAKDLRVSLLDAWQGLEFNGAVGGWAVRDVSSKYINVRDGERATRAPDPALGDPIVIWFFGGSAAFGAGQRDAHTIPSEMVGLAEADGIPLEIHNKAVPATVNWQSAMLLIEQLNWEQPPDLVVFYDGANDVALQGALTGRGQGASDEPASLVDDQVDEAIREKAARSGDRGSSLMPVPQQPDEELSPAEQGALVLRRYRSGVHEIRRATDDADVPVELFWQPDLRAKANLTAGDRKTLTSVGVDPGSIPDYTAVAHPVRSGLPALDVTDLTTVFDGETRPVYWDAVHTNEVGALLVARAMYADLVPTLRALQPKP